MSPKRIATANIQLFSLSRIFLRKIRCRLPVIRYRMTRLNNLTTIQPLLLFLRKEVIQPHLPIRLPCYDFTPVISPAFGSSVPLLSTNDSYVPRRIFIDENDLRSFSLAFMLTRGSVIDFGHYRLPWCDGRCVQDPGTYSPQHSDLRLLAIPASCSRVADYNPN